MWQNDYCSISFGKKLNLNDRDNASSVCKFENSIASYFCMCQYNGLPTKTTLSILNGNSSETLFFRSFMVVYKLSINISRKSWKSGDFLSAHWSTKPGPNFTKTLLRRQLFQLPVFQNCWIAQHKPLNFLVSYTGKSVWAGTISFSPI